MNVSDARAALEKMTKELRVVKNVGELHVRPNSDVTPNYVLEGDDDGPLVGLYKIKPGKRAKMLERWHGTVLYDVKHMYSLLKQYKCKQVAILTCKGWPR